MKRYRITPLILLLSIVFINKRNMFLLFSVAMILSAVVDLQALRTLFRRKFLLFLGILVFGVPLFIGQRESAFLGIPYSHDILLMSINMGLRSLIILTAIKIFTGHVSVDQMSEWLKKIRLKNFSEVFATAMHLLPTVKEISLRTFDEFRNSPKRLNLFAHVFNWTAKLIARLLFFAEDSVPE